jgi:predicted alpha/beta hydrolase family esterase
MNPRPNIVLVHGAWADGSCWSAVIERLQADGSTVTAPQFPAWKSCPSWFLVAEDDQAIPPEAERQFAKRMGATTVAIASGHLAMVSHPDEVAQLIKTAAEAVLVAG